MKFPVKDIKLGNDNKKKLFDGVEKVFDVVSATMGAKGQNVVFYRHPAVRTTKDGVTAAVQVWLEDPFENMGAMMAKEACGKTNINAGDGTTATIVLLHSILKQGIKLMTAGADTILLKKGIERALQIVLEYIDQVKIKKVTNEHVKHVANIALNGDMEIAELIAKAFKKAGENGIVTCREANYNKSYLEVIEGMQIRQGFMFQDFAGNNLTWEAENPAIICHEGQIRNIPSIEPLIQKLAADKRPFLILCHECNLDVVQWLIHNKHKGLIDCCIVRTPGIGQLRNEIIRDFSVLTGAKVLSEYGADIQKATYNDLGMCERVVVGRNESTFYKGNGEKADIEERVQKIRKELDEIEDNKKEIYLQRIARLTSSVSVIHVGGQTEVELMERKDRVNDALLAVKAAIKDGIVPGGGITYLNATQALLHEMNASKGDIGLGIEIVGIAMEAPLSTILRNAGINVAVVLHDLDRYSGENEGEGPIGYDVNKEEYCHLLKDGIIDPALVLKEALQNAVSVALQVMQAQVGIVDKEVKE
ncbi:MAG: chaperonin GroEL [Planctomycetes bacterium]|nr:chaperonin GroEL [Planctomycetota bacterium]